MKKLLAILLAAMMVFALAACGNNETPSGSKGDGSAASQNDNQVSEDTVNDIEQTENNDSGDAEIPTTGLPLNWPDNEYTKLVPAPNCGGKVTAANEIGTLYSVELNWTMEQGLVYAQQLADAGFGDDCAEKYEKHGYIDRTANGINVQLLDLFGTASISIMKVEE